MVLYNYNTLKNKPHRVLFTQNSTFIITTNEVYQCVGCSEVTELYIKLENKEPFQNTPVYSEKTLTPKETKQITDKLGYT